MFYCFFHIFRGICNTRMFPLPASRGHSLQFQCNLNRATNLLFTSSFLVHTVVHSAKSCQFLYVLNPYSFLLLLAKPFGCSFDHSLLCLWVLSSRPDHIFRHVCFSGLDFGSCIGTVNKASFHTDPTPSPVSSPIPRHF